MASDISAISSQTAISTTMEPKYTKKYNKLRRCDLCWKLMFSYFSLNDKQKVIEGIPNELKPNITTIETVKKWADAVSILLLFFRTFFLIRFYIPY